MASETFWLLSELQTAADSFATAASVDPISAVLVVLGGLITAGASLAFGGLVAGAVLDAVADAFSRSPPGPTE
ncbi:hypothetical protein G9C85_09985 [Halorubellus sp. JP-L1]|uniref:hypothetical protein n=1 Tax=Halorubellus sp. JP-L1 TaxID=2715753 RepID=UPI0014078CD1|nr:hypothetical protein [Halorubellus sp. JP-L1]NHN41956.1 hypothetical protein [Halorubellus sp. JP-L1]